MKKNALDRAREVFDIELEGIKKVRDQLGDEFLALVDKCESVLDAGGKIVLCGVGKSGHAGKKISSTLASTGSPAVFMHPVEALHGDLGVLSGNDILIALSYSGETDELLSLLPSAKRFGVPVAAITGNADSELSRWSDVTIPMVVDKEACPFNLAPTTTVTALLALGDALAIVLLERRGFSREDYGRLHPGGAIGRAVTLRVGDVMRTGDRLALVPPDHSVKDALFEMTRARTGSAIVTDSEGKLLGIFTDGDFRRRAEEDINVLNERVGSVMTRNPATLKAEDLAVEVLKVIEARKIDDIIVLNDDGGVAGLVDIQDLPGLKLM